MKRAALILGIALLLYGLHWIGQGTGWLPWPAHTLMDDNIAFAWAGLGLVAMAGGLFWYARRRRGDRL
jgi:LPXTG-motif cell wall-anchored protein